jgi:hypothetical protein
MQRGIHHASHYHLLAPVLAHGLDRDGVESRRAGHRLIGAPAAVGLHELPDLRMFVQIGEHEAVRRLQEKTIHWHLRHEPRTRRAELVLEYQDFHRVHSGVINS